MNMSVWFLCASALVFFMQAGFAMVETGFTRAKNAGNIIMKNTLDFCLGTIAFMLLGYGLLCGTSIGGFLGIPNMSLFTSFATMDWSSFIFNLVFCATAATIVSGAMAERTKFKSYLVYSFVISAFVYPIEAHWVWNSDGWLAKLGYIDFAGSSAIHMVGGISALIGAAILGPRIGKYVGKGKDKKPKAFPGHNITIGALGVFILWFGWYGFNGAAASSATQLAAIFTTTTIAGALSTVTVLLFTWFKNGKPDVSMTLNGCLAGLVGVTAGCANVDALGAAIIGIISGFIVVGVVDLLDKKIHVDDPVGAVAVHGGCGMFGGLAVGLFSTDGGLFYGGGFHLLGIQALGVLCIAAWTAVIMTGVFFAIKKTMGLRVSKEEELMGLDESEHGLVSAYSGFVISDSAASDTDDVIHEVPASVLAVDTVPMEKAVPVTDVHTKGAKMTKIVIVTKQSRFDVLKTALDKISITGMTMSYVLGCGMQKGRKEYYRGVEMETTLLPMVKIEIIVCKVPVETVVETAKKSLYTGNVGDGKIFVYDVENVIKIRTGEEGFAALQDD